MLALRTVDKRRIADDTTDTTDITDRTLSGAFAKYVEGTQSR